MKIIKATTIEGVITPVSELPDSAIKVVFDGTEYVIYENGDEIPAEFVGE